MKTKIIAGLLLSLTSFNSFAGGAIVAGGKTNSAIAIYEEQIDPVTQTVIAGEIGKQVAMGKISGISNVTDAQGKTVRCIQFGLLQTYWDAFDAINDIATSAGFPNAVISVGSCRFDAVN